jgi:hypothetical protein
LRKKWERGRPVPVTDDRFAPFCPKFNGRVIERMIGLLHFVHISTIKCTQFLIDVIWEIFEIFIEMRFCRDIRRSLF